MEDAEGALLFEKMNAKIHGAVRTCPAVPFKTLPEWSRPRLGTSPYETQGNPSRIDFDGGRGWALFPSSCGVWPISTYFPLSFSPTSLPPPCPVLCFSGECVTLAFAQ